MTEDITPTTIIGIKRLAKTLSRRDAVSHTVALDLAAQAAGFSNFKHASRALERPTPSPFAGPAIIIVGNNDGHQFFKKGVLEKVENNGEWAIVVGDSTVCANLTWRGERGLSFGNEVNLSDPEDYAEKVWSTIRYAPPLMGFQSPPDHPSVYRPLAVAMTAFTKMISISFPSNGKDELFEKTVKMLRGVNLHRKSVNVILGTDVSKEFWAS